jgi:phosphoribosyl 1,2-cyclic phosphodiesterase
VRATVWGCRGSLAAPGAETLQYGGNTTCLEVELDDGTVLVVDAGTGIRQLGIDLVQRPPRTLHLLLTHLHLDHIEGLGFFAPLWRGDTELHIWGPPSPVAALATRISRYLSPPLFPIRLDEVPATVICHDFPDEPFELGSATITALPVIHRGPTVGFRFEENGTSLAFIPDHEPYLGVEPGEALPEWLSGYAVAEGVGTLIHDAQYSEDEYASKRGFGHSSIAHAIAFARAAGAGRLVLFHHDPLHTDEQLDALEVRACELWGDDGEPPSLAREGMQLGAVVSAA